MQQGEVKFFNNEKGYGFLKTNGEDIFFHVSEVIGSREPQTGDQVKFDIGENKKGRTAVGITFENTVVQ